MAAHGGKLSRQQERTVACLLAARSIADAAREAGVSERSVRNWLAQPQFASAFAAARRRLLESAVADLAAATTAAVSTLRQELTGERAADRIAPHGAS
jgi:hypothetical protein